MSLAIEPSLDWPTRDDRRGVAREPRRSWASSQPFEARQTPFNDVAARSSLWTQVSGAYRARVVALDALTAIGLGAPMLVGLYGAGPQAVALTLLGAVGFLLMITAAGGYESRQLGDGPAEYQALLRAGVWCSVVLMAVSYVTKAEISRLLVFGGIPLVVGVALLGRYVHRRFLHRARTHGEAMLRTLVIGEANDAARVVSDLGRAPHHGYQVSGVCVPDLASAPPTAGAVVIGAVADVAQIVVDHAIDVVVVAGSAVNGEALRRMSWALDRAGAQLIVAPDIIEVLGPRLTVRPTAGLSLLEVRVGAPRSRMLAKALLDRTAGIALLAAAAPVILLAALAVRLDTPGSAFYRQTRVGLDGVPFTMWKLRSMHIDADAVREALRTRNESNEVLFKIRRDPRVTRVGAALRRYSLDELPQLLNVVKGDMSLVGPRPPLAEEVAVYADAVHRRLRVKPGLTGLWQVSGRSDLSWEESVRLDLRYVDNWSVAMDMMILWKTIRAVLRPVGAY
ncbi:MAG: exopolysaccharide biosynthesis polyprenyl glycosylphosphotransferase [Actinotalea sp.]|nr:exopolysaccharide biosynthesis polyprenyl glycosylphosphotransferase [Actinotalea sp.]